MLSLTRLVKLRVCPISNNLSRALAAPGSSLRWTARYLSDGSAFDFGSLSVPIPLEARHKIPFTGSQNGKPRPLSPSRTASPSRVAPKANKGRRNVARERALARRQRNNQANAKGDRSGKGETGDTKSAAGGARNTLRGTATVKGGSATSRSELGPTEIDGMFSSLEFQ